MRPTRNITVAREPFAQGDGSTLRFKLTDEGAPLYRTSGLVVSAIEQADWGGAIQRLQTSPRTNQVTHSGDLTHAAWVNGFDGTGSAPVVTPNYAAAPDGSQTATRVQMSRGVGGTANDWSSLYQETAVLGTPETGAMWVKSNAGTVKVYLYTLDAVVLATITPQWQRVSALQTDPAKQDDGAADTAVDLSVWQPQLEGAAAPGFYIPTTSAPVTVTDYSVDSEGWVTLGQPLADGLSLTWSGSATTSVLSATTTLLSQYANSPTITALIEAFNAWLDPAADLDNFYNTVWNVQTATGFGLDIWGRIVDVPRQITITPLPLYLGFNEGQPGSYPFNQEPFYSGAPTSSVYLLGDDAYRVLIMTKALANISSFTAPSVNALLRYLFAGRGSCYVLELSPMQIEYVFNFPLASWEAAVLLQPSLMPRPAGVGVTITVNA